jgi:hypothetical protein
MWRSAGQERTLEYLARGRNFVGMTEFADALDTTKTRIHRHLGTLVQQGYVIHAPDTGRYHVGTRLITLGRVVAESTDLSLAAQPHVRAIRIWGPGTPQIGNQPPVLRPIRRRKLLGLRFPRPFSCAIAS